jgi:hypothetical protein
MPPSWVVWAIFASVRFGLVEVSVPPGAATLEKLFALAPGMADAVVDWIRDVSRWWARWAGGGRGATPEAPSLPMGERLSGAHG